MPMKTSGGGSIDRLICEALYSLCFAISFVNKWQLWRKQEEALTNQTGCLDLATHAVIPWNNVYTAAVIERLKAEDYPVTASNIGEAQ